MRGRKVTNDDLAAIEERYVGNWTVLQLCGEVRRLQAELRQTRLQLAEAKEAAMQVMAENTRLRAARFEALCEVAVLLQEKARDGRAIGEEVDGVMKDAYYSVVAMAEEAKSD